MNAAHPRSAPGGGSVFCILLPSKSLIILNHF